MWSLIGFDLKRKYQNQATVLHFLVVFLVIGFILHLDLIFMYLHSDSVTQIYLDPSTIPYQQYFQNTDEVIFQTTTNDTVASLVLEDDWKLYCNQSLSKNVILEITKQVNHIPVLSNQKVSFTTNHELFVMESKIPDYSMELILITFLYFILLSKSSGTVYDILLEKTCGMLDYYLTSFSARKHLLAKILVNWLKTGFDLLISFLFVIIWVMIRFGFGNHQWNQWMNQNVSLYNSYWNGSLVAIGLFSMIVGMLMMQLLIVLFVCKVQNEEEAEKVNFPIQIGCIGLYYLCFYVYQQGWFQNMCGKIFSFIPFLNTLALPMSLLFSRRITIEWIFAFLFAVFLAILGIKYGSNCYRTRVLNIKKQSRYFNLRN